MRRVALTPSKKPLPKPRKISESFNLHLTLPLGTWRLCGSRRPGDGRLVHKGNARGYFKPGALLRSTLCAQFRRRARLSALGCEIPPPCPGLCVQTHQLLPSFLG